MAKSDRCAKGTKMTCGPEYEKYAAICKSKYGQEVSEMYLYENGAIGAFLKNGQFRFIRGSNPETLSVLREKRASMSKSKSKSKSKSASTKKLSVGGAINLLQQFYKNQSLNNNNNNNSKKSAKKSIKKSSKKSMKKSSKKSMRK
jgi:hypothetical protein